MESDYPDGDAPVPEPSFPPLPDAGRRPTRPRERGEAVL